MKLEKYDLAGASTSERPETTGPRFLWSGGRTSDELPEDDRGRGREPFLVRPERIASAAGSPHSKDSTSKV